MRYLAFCILLLAPAAAFEEARLSPDSLSEFLDESSKLLLREQDRQELLALDDQERAVRMTSLLRDPDPATPENEITEAIAHRRRLALKNYLTLADSRAQFLFLYGEPAEKFRPDCPEVFKPLEIWTYIKGKEKFYAVSFQYVRGQPYRIWLQGDLPSFLYHPDMVELLRRWQSAREPTAHRPDYYRCRDAAYTVEKLTGIDWIPNSRPQKNDKDSTLTPQAPEDIASWAGNIELSRDKPLAINEDPFVTFPANSDNGAIARFYVKLPSGGNLETLVTDEGALVKLSIEGAIEKVGVAEPIEEFRADYELNINLNEGLPLVLMKDHFMQKDGAINRVHLRVTDVAGNRFAVLTAKFRIPFKHDKDGRPPFLGEALYASEGSAALSRQPRFRDNLILVPPSDDIVVGPRRIHALVTGKRIKTVTFAAPELKMSSVTKVRPPFDFSLTFPARPKEWEIRAEGFDSRGELVAADRIIVNQPRGYPRIRILEPRHGLRAPARFQAKAELAIPYAQRVKEVRFFINDELRRKKSSPPWEAEIEINEPMHFTALTVQALLVDGTSFEEVRILHAFGYFEEVEINLKQIYVRVTGKGGTFIEGLMPEDFLIFQDGKQQIVSKQIFSPKPSLSLGFVVDSSKSMEPKSDIAMSILSGILETFEPQDSSLLVSFSNVFRLLVPLTNDTTEIKERMAEQETYGDSALFDALMAGFFYLRSAPGCRALVVISDGEESSSQLSYQEILSYAREADIPVYIIGIESPRNRLSLRKKLSRIAEATRGWASYVSPKQSERKLNRIIRRLNEELRQRYLLAYTPQGADSNEEASIAVRIRANPKAKVSVWQASL